MVGLAIGGVWFAQHKIIYPSVLVAVLLAIRKAIPRLTCWLS